MYKAPMPPLIDQKTDFLRWVIMMNYSFIMWWDSNAIVYDSVAPIPPVYNFIALRLIAVTYSSTESKNLYVEVRLNFFKCRSNLITFQPAILQWLPIVHGNKIKKKVWPEWCLNGLLISLSIWTSILGFTHV